mmetsp:Transcript_34215/g.72007  ORF Transcript_34215/g.72007 Transcript_34215/m.72007 type:complete len:614 (+) Transcript_34215:52-1893(+)
MKGFLRFFTFATLLKICAVSFYFGYRNAINENNDTYKNAINETNESPAAAADGSTADCVPTKISASIRQRIDSRLKEELTRIQKESYTQRIFPDTTKEYAVGALRVPRLDLLEAYDFGVPTKPNLDKDMESIILYNTRKSLPSDQKLQRLAVQGQNDGIAQASVSDAMDSCDAMNVIFTKLADKNPEQPECQLLIGNFESYHINRLQRMPLFTDQNKKQRQFNHTLPLRHTGRLILPKGLDEFDLPEFWNNYKKKHKGFLLQHFDALQIFLDNVDSILKDLTELLQKRNVVRDNSVVVMTVNAGQSELLSNFICAAKSRGFDTSNVLVFPTDEESYKLAQGLGVATYFDRKNLGSLPSGEAKFYGDPIFASMMYAKVLCVLYVSLLGHDVLFQDVDIVWFKDPLTFFHDKSNTAIQEFDIMFQHDGSAQSRYNPFSANSGFYYVRANKKTQYLFTSLLYHGAVVRKSKSHQQVLVQLLNEHSSMFGLKVKVFDKMQTDMFPGGFHYHQDWDTMHSIIKGESNAYILHMSWTENKVNKLLFFRQMGEWYFSDKCISNDLSNLIGGGDAVSDGGLVEKCCSQEPIFSCHFKDKPSKVPCPNSPLIDPHRARSFWG